MTSAHAAGDPRVFQKECRTLAEAGYRVSYVVPHASTAVIDGVHVHGVPAPESGRERLSQTTRIVARRAAEVARGTDAVIHFHDAELLPLALGMALRGQRVVYDAHEDTPRQALHMEWIPKGLRRPIGWTFGGLEALGGRVFTGVVAAVPDIASRFPPARTALVRNFPILREDVAGAPAGDRGPVVAYVGAITEARGADVMVRVAGEIGAEHGAVLKLAGDFFPARLEADLSALDGWGRVEKLGYLDRPGVRALLREARVGLVVLRPTPQYVRAYPTKLFEYMAAGVPAVVSDVPLWRRIVEDAGCGLLVDPEAVDEVAAACARLLTDDDLATRLGEAGRAAAAERYSWGSEGERLVAFYDAIAEGRPPGQPSPAAI